MFHTLNGATFQKVDEKKQPESVQLPTAKVTKFYGARARSNTGCLNCRKRKKKCDEKRPKCGDCTFRGELCTWPSPRHKGPKLLANQSRGSTVLDENNAFSSLLDAVNYEIQETLRATLEGNEQENVKENEQNPAKPPIDPNGETKFGTLNNIPGDLRASEVAQELEGFKQDLANFQDALEHSKSTVETTSIGNSGHTDEISNPANLSNPNISHVDTYNSNERSAGVFVPTEFLAEFGFPYVFNLDEEGMRFLECYREQYSTFVSIGLDTLNYFLKTFFSVAASNEGITYALTAWGGFYLELRKPKSDFSKPWEYMQKATRCMCKQMGDYLKPSNKEQFFELFVFYLIFIGIEVCTGDIRNWRGFMNQCSRLIQSYGGISLVSEIFGDSNDIKWLLSDFKFHDLLSSKCLTDGPIFPITEYEKTLRPQPEYGIDPLHGLVGPVYDILALIGQAKADLTLEWSNISSKIDLGPDQANEIATDYYQRVQSVVKDFQNKISACKPLPVHLDVFQHRHHDREMHVALFDLYKHVCRLQLGTSLEKLPPNCVSQQLLLHKALKMLDLLQNTKVKVSLSLLLLVCGMACCTPHDRTSMTRRFRVHLNQYEIGNLQRIEETVVESWAANPHGDVCVDWADFAQAKNWHLYVG